MVEETVSVKWKSDVARGLAEDERAWRRTGQAAEDATRKAGAAADRSSKSTREQARETARAQAAFQRLARELDPAVRAHDRLSRAQAILDRALKAGVITQRQYSSEIKKAERHFAEAAPEASRFRSALLGVAAAAAAWKAVAIVRDVIDTGLAFEKLRAQLETAFGSVEKGAQAFALIQEFAKRTPFSVQELTEAMTRLMALGIDPTIERLTAFGDISAGTGKTVMQFAEAVADAAVGEFERLKEFGIKASKEGDNVAIRFRGATTRVKADSESIVNALTAIGQQNFGGAMDKQAATAGGALSNLGDTFDQLADKVFTSGLGDGLAEVTRSFEDMATSGSGSAEALGETLGTSARYIAEALRYISDHAVDWRAGMQEAIAIVVSAWGNGVADLTELIARMARSMAAHLDVVAQIIDALPGPLNSLAARGLRASSDAIDEWADTWERSAQRTRSNTEGLVDGLLEVANETRSMAQGASEGAKSLADLEAGLYDGAKASDAAAASAKELAAARKLDEERVKAAVKGLAALAKAHEELHRAQRELIAVQQGQERAWSQLQAAERAFREAVEAGSAVMIGGVPVLDARGAAMVALALAAWDVEEATRREREAQEDAIDVTRRSAEAARDRAQAEGELRAMIDGGRAALEEYRRTMAAWAAATGFTDFVGPLTEGQTSIFRDRLAAGEAEQDLDELLDQDKWEQWGRVASNALRDVDADLADIASSLGAAAGAWGDYADAVAAGNEAAARAAQGRMGAAVAGVIGSVATSQGWTGGGTSSFGGRRSGNMMAEGAQIGGMVNGWGAVVGAVLGAFVETGADDARVALEESMSGIRAVVHQAEGGLVDLANEMAATLGQFFNALEIALGQDLEAAGLSIHVRDDLVTVTAGGATQGFRSLSEALAWAVEMTLGQQDLEGVSIDPNMRRVLGSMGGQNPGTQGTFEQLQAAFTLAQQLDDMVAGFGPFGGMMREIAGARENEADLMRRYNLVARDVLALTDLRIAQAKQEVLAARDALLGVSNRTAVAQQVEQMMRAFNAGLDDEVAARQRQAEELRAAIAAREAEAGATAGVVLAGEDLRDALGGIAEGFADAERGGRGAGGAAREGAEAFNDARRERGEETAATIRATRSLEQMREELAAVEASLEGIPSAIPVEEMARVWTAAGAAQFQELLDLVRRVRGEQFGAAEEQRIQGQLYAAQLATSYAALLQLQEASGGLFTVSAAFLTEVESTLQDVLSGAVTPGRPGAGGGQGDARRRAAEDFRRAAADVRAALDGATDSQLGYARSIEQLREQAREGRIPVAELAAAIADLAALQLRDIAAPWEEAARAAGEADVETAMRQLRERWEDALADALARAGDNPAAYEAAAPAIAAGFAAEVAALAQGSLVDLGDRALALQLQTRETAAAIQFLLDHLDELGLTAEDVAAAVRQGALPALLDIAAAAAEAAGDEQALARIRERQRQLERDWMRLQLEALVAQLQLAGAISAEIQAIIDDARRNLGGGPRLGGEGDAGKPSPATNPIFERLAALEEALAGIAARGVSPALQSLREWRAEMRRLQDEIEATSASDEERARRLADLAAEDERQTVAAVRSFAGELDALGVALPVGVTQALAQHELELARARALAALADEDFRDALVEYGVDIGALAREISAATGRVQEAFDAVQSWRPPPSWFPPGSFVPPSNDDGADDLASIREEMAAWLDDLRRGSMHPVEAALEDLADRFFDLRERLLDAGGSVSELADLEAELAEERRRIMARLDDDLRATLADLLGTGDPSLSPQRRLERAQEQWRVTLAAAQGGDLEAREGLGQSLRDYVEALGGVSDTSSAEFQRLYQQLVAAAQAALAGFDAGGSPTLPGPLDFGQFVALPGGGAGAPPPVHVTSTLRLPDLVHTMGRHDEAILAELREQSRRLAALESIAYTEAQRASSVRAAGPRPA